ncbi:RNA polymerase sigma-70 factor [Chitinophaga solisilvae]|uniref:RNA polymerase sigma-70 factor n=1 Tax=Chitinophaga solisilvae TaxID=1233460 RepID=A0A9Q5GKB2_9BACT|nr:RNA polymerase sigma-70 factor [Chitinophaga solisilvae]NSL86030.1 RNA polymerase sigma-70 factor [Chitinophaga solisilvae]
MPDDNASFEELFRKHFVALCTIAYYVVEDKDAARDIVQDFFLDYWSKRHKIRITNDFKSYATGAVRYLSIDYLKRSGRVKLEDLEVIDGLSRHFTAEDREWKEACYTALWKALEQMPEQRRKVFLMSNQDKIKYKDIAEQLGISVNTVKTHIRLALQFLRMECKWVMTTPVVFLLCWKMPLLF